MKIHDSNETAFDGKRVRKQCSRVSIHDLPEAEKKFFLSLLEEHKYPRPIMFTWELSNAMTTARRTIERRFSRLSGKSED